MSCPRYSLIDVKSRTYISDGRRLFTFSPDGTDIKNAADKPLVEVSKSLYIATRDKTNTTLPGYVFSREESEAIHVQIMHELISGELG